MAEVLKTEGLFLRHSNNQVYGPLNLALAEGEGALVLVEDLGLLRRLMRRCLGQDKPDMGRLSWWPGAWTDDRIWGPYDFFRQIGYIDRQCQLIHDLPLLDNLTLHHRYARIPGGLTRSRRILESLGLVEDAAVPAADLAEPRRRLALFALALSQEPRLMLIERPLQFFDRDFALVWNLILGLAVESGLAYVVFDRTRLPYAPEHFSAILTLAPSQT